MAAGVEIVPELYSDHNLYSIDAFIYGVVAPVIPFILISQSHIDQDKLQTTTSLILTGFGILDFIGAPICAFYVDRTTNRRIPFIGGLVIMTVGTIFFGVATAPWMLFLSRVLQGFASAVLYTVGLALLVDTVKREEVGQWMGTALSCNNIGLILSPMFGGLIYHAAGQRAVFWTMIAMIALDAILRTLMLEKPKGVGLGNTQIHVMLEAPSPAHSAAILDETSRSAHTPNNPDLMRFQSESSASTIRTLKSATLPITTLNPTARNRLPSVLRMIRSPRLLAALYGVFLNECVVASFSAVLPLFVKDTFNWKALQAGLIFLTIAIPSFFGFAAGWLGDRFGPRWVATCGLVLTGPTVMLLRLVDHNSKDQIVLLCALLTIIGFTLTLFLAPLGSDLSFVADEESKKYKASIGEVDDGVTSVTFYASSFSLMNSAMAAATLFSPLFTGWLNQSHGWGTMTAVLGAIVLSGAVPCIFFTGSKTTKANVLLSPTVDSRRL